MKKLLLLFLGIISYNTTWTSANPSHEVPVAPATAPVEPKNLSPIFHVKAVEDEPNDDFHRIAELAHPTSKAIDATLIAQALSKVEERAMRKYNRESKEGLRGIKTAEWLVNHDKEEIILIFMHDHESNYHFDLYEHEQKYKPNQSNWWTPSLALINQARKQTTNNKK